MGTGFGRLGLPAPGLFARLALALPASQFLLVVFLGLFVPFFNPLGNLGLGFRQGFQAIFPARDFHRQIDTVGQFFLINFRRLFQQGLHFLAQLRFQLFDVAMGQGLVLRRIGLDPFGFAQDRLGTVQRNLSQLDELHRLRQRQHLYEQVLQLHQKGLAEMGQGVMIGMMVGGNEPERH